MYATNLIVRQKLNSLLHYADVTISLDNYDWIITF